MAVQIIVDSTADFSAKEIALKALKIAGDICIFTNGHITVEEV